MLVLDGWQNFAVASVGIAGALAGLIFVGISLNLDFVLEHSHLTSRAATALATLLGVAVVNLCVLMPHQGRRHLALFVGLVSLVLLTMAIRTYRATVKRRKPGDPRAWAIQPFVLNLVTPLTMAAATTRLLAAGSVGLFALATITGLVAAVWEAWVLLIEIRR